MQVFSSEIKLYQRTFNFSASNRKILKETKSDFVIFSFSWPFIAAKLFAGLFKFGQHAHAIINTTHTYINYKFHKRWLFKHTSTEISWEKYLPAPRFEPMTIWLTSSCQGITSLTLHGFVSLLLITLPPLVASALGSHGAVTKTLLQPAAILTRTCASNRVAVHLLNLQPRFAVQCWEKKQS